MPKDIVEITCYGKTKKMERKDAIDFYLDCMMNSEGSERDRYVTIYCELIAGLNKCSDGDGEY